MLTQLYQGKSLTSLAQVFLFICLWMVSGCATSEKRDEIAMDSAASEVSPSPSPIDPYEGFNRSIYGFNMGLDKYLFKPVSDGYKFITPDFVEAGVSNFFDNLKGINVVLNDVLQGKFQQSASDAGRFLTNTTIGVGGLFDVASRLGMQHNIEDFGQTLAVWGVQEGVYLVLPVMGPTTLRDGSGLIVDKAANPGTYVPFTGILEGINDRANAEGALNFINEAALDPYVFTRESFLQYRQHLINDGKNHDNEELEAAIEEADDLEADGSSSAVKVAVESAPEMDEGTPPADRAMDRSLAYDNMVQSFEQASLKIDQLDKETSNVNFTRSVRSRYSFSN